MKKVFIVFAILFAPILKANGEDLHSPAEILNILNESKIIWEVGVLEKPITSPDRSENINSNNFYREEIEDGIVLKKYELTAEARKYLDSAEVYYTFSNYQEARKNYLKALELSPGYSPVMVFIGETYDFQDEIEVAMEWYQKAIDSNFIDYMAHWFLADNYRKLGENEKAVEEITIASILNRNNPRLQKSLEIIYAMNDLDSEKWEFTPQILIDSLEPGKISIKSNSEWMGYALAKALWTFEPGYKESMGCESNTLSSKEEKECLVALAVSFDDETKENNKVFRILNEAIFEGKIDSFILYEIFLPEYPIVAYNLPKNQILEIKDYILEIRAKN